MSGRKPLPLDEPPDSADARAGWVDFVVTAAAGFFNADAFDGVAGFAVVGLLASAELDLAPAALELRCFSAEVCLATFEFDLLPLDSDELERVDPDVELSRLLEPLPDP